MWSYQPYEAGHPGEVAKLILAYVNQHIASEYAPSVKIAMSDMSGGKARGVVYYCKDTVASFPKSASQWMEISMSQDKGGYEGLYTFALKQLNSLSMPKALLAQVAFTNLKGGPATMTVFHPNTVS